MRVDVKEFEYLVALADSGSVTKAANEMFITQSAMSRFVKNKETELGTPLFERIGKRFIPTYAGERCIETARKILLLNRQMNDEVDRIAKWGKGRIRLAFNSSWSDFFFSAIYREFRKKHESVDLQIFELNSNETLRMMDNGELDMAVVATAWENHSRYVCESLRTQRMVLAVSKEHPLVAQAENHSDYLYPFISLEEIRELPLVVRHAGQRTHEYAMGLLASHRISPHIVLEATSRENVLRAVQHGFGVTFSLDDPVPLQKYPNIRYLSYEDINNQPTYVNVIYNKGSYISQEETDLITLIRNYYQLL